MPATPTPKAEGLLTPKQVGLLLGLHAVTVIRYGHQGAFPNWINHGGQSNGRRYGIPQRDVDNYLQAHRIRAA